MNLTAYYKIPIKNTTYYKLFRRKTIKITQLDRIVSTLFSTPYERKRCDF